MKLGDIEIPSGINKDRKRVGRGHGSGHVKTAGKGTKGQKARTGGNVPPRFEGGQTPLQQKLPYKRGFKNIWTQRYNIVNVAQLASLEAGSTVTLESLLASSVLREPNLPLKVLGTGEITVALKITADRVSEGARKKIEAAGGTITLTEAEKQPSRSKGRTDAPIRSMKARQAAK